MSGLSPHRRWGLARAAIGVTLTVSAPVAARDDAGVNGGYERMSAAYATLDAARLEGVFHPALVTPPSDATRPAVLGGRAMEALIARGLARLRETGRTAELKFRVTHRSWADADTAVDLGVLRMTVKSGDATPRVTYARFLTTIAKQPDGRWSFLVDAPAPAEAQAWDAAAPAPNAKFDQ